MDTQTLTTLIAMGGFAIALFTYLATMKRDLRTETATRFEQVDKRFEQLESRMNAGFTSIDKRFEQLESRMNVGFTSVDTRLGVLEHRTYELAAARRPDAS